MSNNKPEDTESWQETPAFGAVCPVEVDPELLLLLGELLLELPLPLATLPTDAFPPDKEMKYDKLRSFLLQI